MFKNKKTKYIFSDTHMKVKLPGFSFRVKHLYMLKPKFQTWLTQGLNNTKSGNSFLWGRGGGEQGTLKFLLMSQFLRNKEDGLLQLQF